MQGTGNVGLGSRRHRVVFEELFLEIDRPLRNRVRKLASPRLRRSYDTDDIVQEIKAAAWKLRKRFGGSTRAEFFAWIRPIADHTVANLTKRISRRKRSPQGRVVPIDGIEEEGVDPSWVMPIESLEAEEVEKYVREALARISKNQHDLIEAVYYRNQTIEEVARELDASPGAVRKRLGRQLQRLRIELRRGAPELFARGE